MEMQTAIYAAVNGVLDQIHARVDEMAEIKDLLVTLRERTSCLM